MSANQCLVDTSAWFALFVPIDPDHQRVRDALSEAGARLITTDYILDETLTLLRARGQYHRAVSEWSLIRHKTLVTVIHTNGSRYCRRAADLQALLGFRQIRRV